MKTLETTIFIPDLLLHTLEVITLSLQADQILAGGAWVGCKGCMQGLVLAVIFLELAGLFLQLLAEKLVAHRWRRTARATTAGGSADRSAALGFQVSGGSSSLGHRQSVRLCLAFQGVGGGLGSTIGSTIGSTVGLGRGFSGSRLGSRSSSS